MLSCSSGKCQISHWRQGHKDECFPPTTTARELNDENITSRTSVLETQPGLHGNGFDYKSSCVIS